MAALKRVAIALEIDQPYPQHQDVFAGVQRFAKVRGDWLCVIDEHPCLQTQRRGTPRPGYDGVIARATDPLRRRLKRLGIPLVNTHYQEEKPGTYGVYPDPTLMGQLAAEHLLDRGFRRLAAFGDHSHKHSWQISAAFKTLAEERAATCDLHHLPEMPYIEPSSWRELESAIGQALTGLTSPVAVFLESASTARLVIQQCTSRGWRVPQDVAVLCQYNLKAIVDVSPQISSVEGNYEALGYEAAALLARMMAGEQVPAEPIFVAPRQVIARESTDYYAVEDAIVASALRHISRNIASPLPIEEIAYALAISPRQLQLRFDKALGHGISDEIRRLRLARAKRLLTNPDIAIGSIAEQCGFGRPQLFNAVFRRETGMTPSHYRKRLLGETGGEV
jgi:LacI family transcriptional regulator